MGYMAEVNPFHSLSTGTYLVRYSRLPIFKVSILNQKHAIHHFPNDPPKHFIEPIPWESIDFHRMLRDALAYAKGKLICPYWFGKDK